MFEMRRDKLNLVSLDLKRDENSTISSRLIWNEIRPAQSRLVVWNETSKESRLGFWISRDFFIIIKNKSVDGWSIQARIRCARSFYLTRPRSRIYRPRTPDFFARLFILRKNTSYEFSSHSLERRYFLHLCLKVKVLCSKLGHFEYKAFQYE